MEPLNDPAALAAELAELANAAELEPCKVPTMDHLTYQMQDIIRRYTGVEVMDPDQPWGRKLAASEWFWRNLRGQRVSFDQVYAAGSVSNVEQQEANPTSASD